MNTCNSTTMKFPAVFVNHGGGPLPLLGKQQNLVEHMRDVVKTRLPSKPSAILVLSAHWESDPIKITSATNPTMLFDYYGFPPESYDYKYPAPGSPDLARRIQTLLDKQGIQSELDEKRGFDHGVFVPLLIMYPEANIPVVCVSLHTSLDPNVHISVGQALQPLRDDDVLILGSGYTFHNLKAFFNPSSETYKASTDFNEWLKQTMASDNVLERLKEWESAPSARMAHPREEHVLPLIMAAATGGTPQLIFDVEAKSGEHAVSGYLFQ
jgi:aromatic ring-opening dioxygenase catalytic subunit (LigB family)